MHEKESIAGFIDCCSMHEMLIHVLSRKASTASNANCMQFMTRTGISYRWVTSFFHKPIDIKLKTVNQRFCLGLEGGCACGCGFMGSRECSTFASMGFLPDT